MTSRQWYEKFVKDAALFNRVEKLYTRRKNKKGLIERVFAYSVDDLNPEDKGVIDRLLKDYGISESLEQNTYAKLAMMARLLDKKDVMLAKYAQDSDKETIESWNPRDREDYEREMESRKEGSISSRDKVVKASMSELGRFWITNSGQVLPVDPGIHHAEWIMDHLELLDDRERRMVSRYKDSPNQFTERLFADNWIRISGNVAQMYYEHNMPKLAEFLKSRDDLDENSQVTIVFTGNGKELDMSIRDIIAKYDPTPVDNHLKLVASEIGGKGSKKPDSDFDSKQLEKGTKHEADEHNLSEEDAKGVAKDHLVELPDYYDEIQKLEKKLKSEGTLRISARDNEIENMIKYTKKYIKPKSKDNKAAEEMVEYTKQYKGKGK